MTASAKNFKSPDGRVELIGGDPFRNMRPTFQIHERDHLGFTARLAVKLVEHFGFIAVKPDGLDEAGRQKMTLLPPREAAARAMDIAEAMTSEIRRRGHFIEMPSLIDDADPS